MYSNVGTRDLCANVGGHFIPRMAVRIGKHDDSSTHSALHLTMTVGNSVNGTHTRFVLQFPALLPALWSVELIVAWIMDKWAAQARSET